MKFKAGDRVQMIEPQSRYTGRTGTVVGFRVSVEHGEELIVRFDCNVKGHNVVFPSKYFSKLPPELKASGVQAEREDYTRQYAEWFASAYQSITESGGDPMTVLERIGYTNIDTMVRNHLFIVYKGPME